MSPLAALPLGILGGTAVAMIGYCGTSLVRARLSDRRRRKALRTINLQMGVNFAKFATGGIIPLTRLTPTGTPYNFTAELDVESEPLEETWSNEKVEAWRIVDVTVEEGDPDGLWLGFPHPDGPTKPVVSPVRHPVGVELHAECKPPRNPVFLTIWLNEGYTPCEDVPGENCASAVGSGCGFYAYKTQSAAVSRLALMNSPWTVGSYAIAKVLLSGKVIEHEGGYRAEILEVVECDDPEPQTDPFVMAAEQLLQSLKSWPMITGGSNT